MATTFAKKKKHSAHALLYLCPDAKAAKAKLRWSRHGERNTRIFVASLYATPNITSRFYSVTFANCNMNFTFDPKGGYQVAGTADMLLSSRLGETVKQSQIDCLARSTSTLFVGHSPGTCQQNLYQPRCFLSNQKSSQEHHYIITPRPHQGGPQGASRAFGARRRSPLFSPPIFALYFCHAQGLALPQLVDFYQFGDVLLIQVVSSRWLSMSAEVHGFESRYKQK